MTFLQLLVAVEDMQSQQRAEAGVQEIIIGYVGEDYDDSEEFDPTELTGFEGPIYESSMDTLPPDIRDVVEVEMHRMRTGELLSIDQWKQKKEGR